MLNSFSELDRAQTSPKFTEGGPNRNNDKSITKPSIICPSTCDLESWTSDFLIPKSNQPHHGLGLDSMREVSHSVFRGKHNTQNDQMYVCIKYGHSGYKETGVTLHYKLFRVA